MITTEQREEMREILDELLIERATANKDYFLNQRDKVEILDRVLDVRLEIAVTKTELLEKIHEVKNELGKEIHELKTELRKEIHEVRLAVEQSSKDNRTWMLATMITLVVMILGLYAMIFFTVLKPA